MERTTDLLSYAEDGIEINDQTNSSFRIDDSGDVNAIAVLNNTVTMQDEDAASEEPTDLAPDNPATIQFLST